MTKKNLPSDLACVIKAKETCHPDKRGVSFRKKRPIPLTPETYHPDKRYFPP